MRRSSKAAGEVWNKNLEKLWMRCLEEGAGWTQGVKSCRQQGKKHVFCVESGGIGIMESPVPSWNHGIVGSTILLSTILWWNRFHRFHDSLTSTLRVIDYPIGPRDILAGARPVGPTGPWCLKQCINSCWITCEHVLNGLCKAFAWCVDGFLKFFSMCSWIVVRHYMWIFFT